jgi:dTDP-4-dehydrorhamnose reductase
MRIVILGGDGMLGHRLFQTLKPSHDVRVTIRQPLAAYADFGLFDASNTLAEIDVRSLTKLIDVFAQLRPQAVINCVGVIKQRADGEDVVSNLEINAMLPHRLAELCKAANARLIHISTDCVFSGRKGMYKATDNADASDVYGRTKFLGEVSAPGCLTLRTSMIGRELARKLGLLEWFLAQQGTVRGFKRAIFSGFTTIELSRIIKMMIEHHPDACGLYHVAAEPIDKFSLLMLLREHYRKDIRIEPDEAVVIDRSLDASEFRTQFRYLPPAWPDMIAELQ